MKIPKDGVHSIAYREVPTSCRVSREGVLVPPAHSFNRCADAPKGARLG